MERGILHTTSACSTADMGESTGMNKLTMSLLQKEQAEKLKMIAGANPFVLNCGTSMRKKRREIDTGVYYTHSKLSVGKICHTTNLRYRCK